jgi:predicted enzyme related to lactoylglutathione lyase
MEITLGRAIILVHDYDLALKFYDKIFDCRVLFDHTDQNGVSPPL